MSKRITVLDVLGEARRARRILNRLIRYLEQQERAERRAGEKHQRTYEAKAAAARENARLAAERARHGGELPSERAMRQSNELGEQG